MNSFLSQGDEATPGHAPLVSVAPVPAMQRELPHCLGRIGTLELRLAQTANEVFRAQALRHQVFFRDRPGIHFIPPGKHREQDAFDSICDHLLVIDTAMPDHPVVGTYRLLRQTIADSEFGFYSETEFTVRPLLQRHNHLQFLELGRSCVLAAYRERRTIELLWQGLWSYVRHYRIGAMMGCASFDGTFVNDLAIPLSYLVHEAGADEHWQVQARADRAVCFDLIGRANIDERAALRAMPPLIKGYLRAGAQFSRDVVVDPVFGTTDIFVVMPTALIRQKYIRYFGESAERLAA